MTADSLVIAGLNVLPGFTRDGLLHGWLFYSELFGKCVCSFACCVTNSAFPDYLGRKLCSVMIFSLFSTTFIVNRHSTGQPAPSLSGYRITCRRFANSEFCCERSYCFSSQVPDAHLRDDSCSQLCHSTFFTPAICAVTKAVRSHVLFWGTPFKIIQAVIKRTASSPAMAYYLSYGARADECLQDQITYETSLTFTIAAQRYSSTRISRGTWVKNSSAKETRSVLSSYVTIKTANLAEIGYLIQAFVPWNREPALLRFTHDSMMLGAGCDVK